MSFTALSLQQRKKWDDDILNVFIGLVLMQRKDMWVKRTHQQTGYGILSGGKRISNSFSEIHCGLIKSRQTCGQSVASGLLNNSVQTCKENDLVKTLIFGSVGPKWVLSLWIFLPIHSFITKPIVTLKRA